MMGDALTFTLHTKIMQNSVMTDYLFLAQREMCIEIH